MLYLNAIILGIVEGITEFLPISSTGHLIVFQRMFPISLPGDGFSEVFIVVIQLPAIFAVIGYFWGQLWPFQKPEEGQLLTAVKWPIMLLWTKIAVAVLPVVVLGLAFVDQIDELLDSPIPVGITLVVGGFVLLLVDWKRPPVTIEHASQIGFGRAIIIGLFQCLALIPGTSRAAATIVGGMVVGTTRSAAAEFSFFLAIPTMLGATLVSLRGRNLEFTASEWGLLLTGSLVSFLTAYAVVVWLMRYLQHGSWRPFGYYRIVVGIGVLIYFLAIAPGGADS